MKPVAFYVIGSSGLDWCHKGSYQGWIHLAIAIKLDDYISTVCQSCTHASKYCPSYAGVEGMHQHLYAWIRAVFSHDRAGALGAGVIHHIDQLHFSADASYYSQDLIRHPVSRNHNRQ